MEQAQEFPENRTDSLPNGPQVHARVGASRITVSAGPAPGVRVQVTTSAEELARPEDVAYAADLVPTVPSAPARTAASNTSPAVPAARVTLPDLKPFLAGLLTSLRAANLQWILFILAIGLYLTVRLVRLPDFPIYFFTDEAVQTTLAQDFLRDGLRGYDNQFFPTYFYNQYQYNLSLSVYLQAIPSLLFGKSIWVTRGISVLVSILAPIWCALILKRAFKSPYPWLAALLLSLTPTWFLHSRTAFETVLGTTFYAGFLYFYLLYRTQSPRYLYAAIGLAALMFYAYSPARMVLLVAIVLLFLTDLPYHWQNRTVLLKGLGLVILVALPMVRFMVVHPEESANHLRQLNSYWIEPISFTEKLKRYWEIYQIGISPAYWFGWREDDLVRHIMKGYGHLARFTIPFILIGLVAALRKIRSAPHRALLIALIAAPTGSALVGIGVTRLMSMVIPSALLAGLGLSLALEWIQKRVRLRPAFAAVPVFIALAGYNVWMLRDSLVNGPFWYTDYGLGGMQWGGQTLFTEINAYSEEHPGTHVVVSPSWANGTDVIARFFSPENASYRMGNIDGFIDEQQELTENTVIVMIPEEYERMTESGKFTDVRVEKTISYPDGSPGFRFVRLRYVDNIDAIFEQERAQRRILLEANLSVGEQIALVKYSYLDMGKIEDAFDGDDDTVLRTMEANPLVIKLQFDEPLAVNSFTARVGGSPTRVSIRLLDAGGQELLTRTAYYEFAPHPRAVSFEWDEPVEAAQVEIEVENVNDQEPAKVHLWEIRFNEPGR